MGIRIAGQSGNSGKVKKGSPRQPPPPNTPISRPALRVAAKKTTTQKAAQGIKARPRNKQNPKRVPPER
jgi:hypothetical protein